MTAHSLDTANTPASFEGEILEGRYVLTEARSRHGERGLYLAFDVTVQKEVLLYVWRDGDGALRFRAAPTLRRVAARRRQASRKMEADLLEAAWFARGEKLEEEDDTLGEAEDYVALQQALELTARQLSGAEYRRFSLEDGANSAPRKRKASFGATLSLARLILEGAH